MEKMPPVEKVYEAYSAIADGRVAMGEGSATIRSSDGAKKYTVQWDSNGSVYRSNDSATYWQGYAGYPVIAVLMLQGKLPFDKAVAQLFAGINWTELNKKHKRNYAAAAQEALDALAQSGTDTGAVEPAAKAVCATLGELDISVRRGGKAAAQG